MIRITIGILIIMTITGCRSFCGSPLVLKSDLWVMSIGDVSCYLSSEMKTVDSSIEFMNNGTFIVISCSNDFEGQYTTQDNDSVQNMSIVVENLKPELSDYNLCEQKYIESLKQVRSYEAQDGLLEMMDSDGRVVLTCVPASKMQKQ